MKSTNNPIISAGKTALIFFIASMLSVSSFAQTTYQKGRHIEPAYEGWRPNPDGSYSFMFGYMNENWLEEPFVPVGDENFFSPGDRDQGQPTKFLPPPFQKFFSVLRTFIKSFKFFPVFGGWGGEWPEYISLSSTPIK